MIDYFLKFADLQEAQSVLPSVGVDMSLTHGNNWDIYVIGHNYIDGVAQPGYLVNLRARTSMPELDPYSIIPEQPIAVFA